MAQAAAQPSASAAAAAAEGSLLDEIVTQSKVARSDTEHARAKDIISELVREVMQGTVVVSDNLGVTLDARIAEIDQLLSEQLSEVMHNAEFQQLESSWTGLHYLCKHTSTGAMMKIQVFSASKKELIRDFQTAIDFDQSALFKKVYEEEFGTFGGAPFGALIGDYERLGRQPAGHRTCWRRSRNVAAAAHAPFLSAANAGAVRPRDSFTEIGRPARPGQDRSDAADYVKWRSRSGSRRIRAIRRPGAAAHPDGRLPYGAGGRHRRSKAFNFTEDVDGSDARANTSGGTPPTPSGRPADGVVRQATAGAPRSAGSRGGAWSRACRRTPSRPTRRRRGPEVPDGDRHHRPPREGAVATWASSRWCTARGPTSPRSSPPSRPSRRSHLRQRRGERQRHAVLSTQLAVHHGDVCRIAHYLKSMMRDKIGSFASAGNVQEFLNRWIRQYVVEDDNASQETKAAYPLREANVQVSEVPGRPGVYRAVSFIRPHFQLDELSVSLRLVAELPQSQKG